MPKVQQAIQTARSAASAVLSLPASRRSQQRMQAFYRQFIRSGDLCFDVGANIGNRAAAFAALGARVVAIEPQTNCVHQMQRRFKNNAAVTIIAAGLSDHEGNTEIAICENVPAISTMSDQWRTRGRFAKSYQWTRTERVPLITLDMVIDRYGVPAFCKTDVEGYEPQVLAGLSQPLPLISFEFTYEFIQNAWACLDHLTSLGTLSTNYSLGESMTFASPTWLTMNALRQRLASNTDSEIWGDIYARVTPTSK